MVVVTGTWEPARGEGGGREIVDAAFVFVVAFRDRWEATCWGLGLGMQGRLDWGTV